MRPRSLPAPAAAFLAALCAAAAHAGPVDWSYAWGGSPFAVYANGGTREGAVNLVLPGDGVSGPPVSPVALRAFTALRNGADSYDDAAYSLTFTVSDPDSGQSHALTLHGVFDGTVTSNLVSLRNTFTGGSGVQAFDFLGLDYTVTFGFAATDASPRSWAGDIGASVQIGAAPSAEVAPAAPPPGSASPEPASLVLAALALPGLGLLARRLRRR